MARPKVFIGLPTADGIVLAGTTASLARMTARLSGRGIATEFATVDGLDIVGQHNRLVEAFLRSDCTHLLFVDSDMEFGADLCERLLAGRHPVAGTVYPKRRLDLARLERFAADRPFDHALALAYEWNVHLLPEGVRVEDGWCRVAALPGGFVLIERRCFEQLEAAGDAGAAPGGGPRAFYRELREGLAIYDLDYSFCLRWRAVGGEVWAYAAAEIRHVGDSRVGPPFGVVLGALGRKAQRAVPA